MFVRDMDIPGQWWTLFRSKALNDLIEHALNAATSAEKAAAKSLAIAHAQLELGDVGYLTILNAEQIYQQAVLNRIQAVANRYADTVALFQALGGGWWNRADAPSMDRRGGKSKEET